MEFDNLKEELLSVVDTGLKYGRNLDSSIELEIYMFYESNAEAEIAQGVVTAKDGVTTGNAVRAARGKQVGFACASGIASDRVKFSVNEAISIIDAVSVEDERFSGFCDPKSPGNEGLVSDEILAQGVEDLLGYCQEMMKDATGVDDRVIMLNPSASTSWGGYAVGNTRGVQSATRYGICFAAMYAMSKEGEERKTAFEYEMARDSLFDVSKIGSRAVKEAVGQHGAKKLDATKTMTTIWHPKASATYISASLGQSVLGQPVVEQISPLCDRIGDNVAPDFLTVIDDGQSPDSLGANAIDAEGHPQQVNNVIENGVLKSFLFDTYFGRAHGVDSTGNCARGGGAFGGSTPYESGPSATTKTLKISPGSKSYDDLIAVIDEPALLIAEFPIGIFHSSVATGEFSAVANCAFLVEKGEIQYPVQPCSVAGNFYDGYQNIKSIGSDVTVTYFGVNAPTFVIDGFSVVG